MRKISAKKGNGGYAIAKAVVLSSFAVPENRQITDIREETRRYKTKLKETAECFRNSIEKARLEKDDKGADILKAQLMMLEDEQFDREIMSRVEQNSCCEYAVYQAAEKMAEELLKSDSEYLRARSSDVQNVAKKIIEALSGMSVNSVLLEDAVILADDISPEDIIRMDKSHVKAIATVKGSSLSHTAILAGTYGIPYIFGIPSIPVNVQGTEVIVDGEDGLLILEPDEETQNEYKIKIDECEKTAEIPEGSLPVKIYANIAGPSDLEAVIKNGAEGIGLFRTEFLFMEREDLPSEEEQFNVYSQVAMAMNGKEVIIRTMDIGADKKTECLQLPDEENPALGKRAIRICLEDTDLFRTQLRACLRAAVFGNIKIMYPMIASAWEIDEINEQLKIAETELKNAGVSYVVPECGIMIETPAAAVTSDILARKVSFFSIGTNDLTQYTLAADRTGESMDRYFDSGHEAVMRMIKISTENAHKYGITVGVCGEIGGNPDIIPKLLEIGVDELSMSPGKIPKAKEVISKCISSSVSHETVEPLTAPCDGILIPMEEIPDEAFASGTLGNCIAVDPDDGNIYAPCSGIITMVADTKHAIGIHSDEGNDILIHAGIDTVKLNGEGFESKVKKGQHVTQGELILTENVETVKKHGLSTVVILVY